MWKLILNNEQLDVIKRALDVYSRLHAGQFSAAFEMFDHLSFDERRILENYIKPITHSKIGSCYYGIYAKDIHPDAQVAWDIYQVIRYKISWDRCNKDPEYDQRTDDMYGVHYDAPMKASTQPLPELEKINE